MGSQGRIGQTRYERKARHYIVLFWCAHKFTVTSVMVDVHSSGDTDEFLGEHHYPQDILAESGGGEWVFISVRALDHRFLLR